MTLTSVLIRSLLEDDVWYEINMKKNGRHAVHLGNYRIVAGLYIGFWVGLWTGIRALKKQTKNSENAITILLGRIASQIHRMDNPNNPVSRAALHQSQIRSVATLST